MVGSAGLSLAIVARPSATTGISCCSNHCRGGPEAKSEPRSMHAPERWPRWRARRARLRGPHRAGPTETPAACCSRLVSEQGRWMKVKGRGCSSGTKSCAVVKGTLRRRLDRGTENCSPMEIRRS